MALGHRLPGRGGRCSVSAAAIGTLVLAAWLLRPWLPGMPEWVWLMKSNTALCLLASGVALGLQLAGGGRAARGASIALAGSVIFLGAATLLQYATGIDLGVDTLLTADQQTDLPGRMSPQSAASFILLALGTLCCRRDRGPKSWICDGAIVGSGVLLQLVLSGYLYRQLTLTGISTLTRTAPHTLAGLALIWSGLVLVRVNAGMLRTLARGGPGSTAARALLPATILLPVAVGALRLWGEVAGLYSIQMGIALFASTHTVLLAALVLAFSNRLNHTDELRKQEQSRRRELERMVALCAWTKKVRWNGEWVPVERFLKERFDIVVTHGIAEDALPRPLAPEQRPDNTPDVPGSSGRPRP